MGSSNIQHLVALLQKEEPDCHGVPTCTLCRNCKITKFDFKFDHFWNFMNSTEIKTLLGENFKFCDNEIINTHQAILRDAMYAMTTSPRIRAVVCDIIQSVLELQCGPVYSMCPPTMFVARNMVQTSLGKACYVLGAISTHEERTDQTLVVSKAAFVRRTLDLFSTTFANIYCLRGDGVLTEPPMAFSPAAGEPKRDWTRFAAVPHQSAVAPAIVHVERLNAIYLIPPSHKLIV
jgi:hypothetical protein